jgi:hypothetical protein
MGLPAGLSSYPKGQDNSGVAAEEPSGPHHTEHWFSGNADLKPLDNKLWDVLEDMACRKHHNSLESLKRSPWRRSVQRQQSGRSVSRLAARHRAAILSDIIINENLKLLQINYLAQKVAFFFNFPSRSHCTCNRTYGKTNYILKMGGIEFTRMLLFTNDRSVAK